MLTWGGGERESRPCDLGERLARGAQRSWNGEAPAEKLNIDGLKSSLLTSVENQLPLLELGR